MDIEELRLFCLSLPHATEDVKWGNDLCFCIAEKMFCACTLDAPLRVSFKVPQEDFEELTNSQDIIPAPYLARHKWVYVQNANRLQMEEWEKYLRQSYQLIRDKLPSRIQKQLDEE